MKKTYNGWYEVSVCNVKQTMLFHPKPEAGVASLSENRPVYINVSHAGTYLLDDNEILQMAELIIERRERK